MKIFKDNNVVVVVVVNVDDIHPRFWISIAIKLFIKGNKKRKRDFILQSCNLTNQ